MDIITPDCIDSKARACFRQLCFNCTKRKCGQFVSPLSYSTLRQMITAFLLSKITFEDVPSELDFLYGSLVCHNFQESRRKSVEELNQERYALFLKKLEERQLRLF